MNALILTCNTGEGHNSVSEAIGEAIVANGQSCRIVDALSFLSERASQFICSVHVRMYRYMPKVYGSGYRRAETHGTNFDENSPVRKFLASGAERLHSYIVEGGFDCVICPHVIPSLMVTEMFDSYPQDRIQSCNVATDYTCSPMTEDTKLDWYFVPDRQIVSDFIDAGVPAEKIVPIDGIPVQRQFYIRGDKAEARLAVGLPVDAKHLLVMFGSMGCGPMVRLSELLSQQLPEGSYATVVCGTNASVQKKLRHISSRHPNIRVLGYTKSVSKLMDSADLFLTKPGGISTSEAAVKGLPMVLADTVGSCESYNLRLFCGMGGAVTADTPDELARTCAELLRDSERLCRMSDALGRREDSAGSIYSKLMERYDREEAKYETTCI